MTAVLQQLAAHPRTAGASDRPGACVTGNGHAPEGGLDSRTRARLPIEPNGRAA